MNKICKVILSFVCFFSFIIFSIIIHELSHVIVALCFGNKVLEFGFYFKDDVISLINLCVRCRIDYINPSSRVFVSMAGSIGNIIMCLIFVIFSVKKRILSLLFSNISMINVELLYWIISPVIGFGDAYKTYKLLGITNYYLLSIIYLGIYIIILIFYIKILVKTLSERKTKRGMLKQRTDEEVIYKLIVEVKSKDE